MSDNTPNKEQVELSPIQWMDKAIQSLYVQLPESVANDVSKRWEVVKIYLIGKVKDAFYYRDGHPRDGYLWSQFNSAHDLAASARYHQEPVETEGLVMWNDIDNELIDIDKPEDAKKYVMDNYVDGNEMHPDFSSFPIFKKVGSVGCKEDGDVVTGIYVSINAQPQSPVAERDERLVWVSVKDRPLVTVDDKGNWTCTDDGEKDFIAALEVINRIDGKVTWWIKHCVIEDSTGLCVVGDDDNEPAGWDVKDVQFYFHIPKPPGETPSHEGKDAVSQNEIWETIDEVKEDQSPYFALSYIKENYNLYKQKL